MNILILFQFSNHNQTIDELCNTLNRKGIKATSFNIVTWRLRNINNIGKIFWVKLLSFFAAIPKLRGFLTILLMHKTILKLSDTYCIIDIHFFSPIYDKLIEEFKKKGKKVKITIWGSDFYRSDTIRLENQRRIYRIIDIIQIETRQIANDFIKVYPECVNKVRIAHFGIIQFDIIDELLQEEVPGVYKKEMNLPADKIIFTIGTNGNAGHQHMMILESIESQSSEIKKQLFLIIPMTYNGSKSYIEKIRQKAELLGLPYRIITSFLSIKDICKLRIVSDITLTIQITDALSAAIQEHIYTGGILIAGKWLPYQILNEHGVFYLTTSLESLSGTISDTVENYKSLLKNCSGNNVKLSKLSSWNNVIEQWLNIYNEIGH